MKLNDFVRSSVFYKPTLAAFLLALSRLPLHLGFLVFFGMMPLFSFFDEKPSIKQIIKAAITFGVIYGLVCLHWISLVTLPGFFGMLILFGLYFSILFYLISSIWKLNPKIKYLAFICFWLSFEYLQNFGEFSFPWFNVAYSLGDYLPFIQPADIGGIYLLSALIILVNILIYELRNNYKRNLITLITVIIIWAGYGFIRLQTMKLVKTDTKISIVQVSIPQDKKWEQAYLDTTLKYYEDYTILAAEQGSSLIIWPESATPMYLLRQAKYKRWILDQTRTLKKDIFTGFPHYKYLAPDNSRKYKFYNAATRFDKNGKIYPPYYKNVLVPFGERIPLLNVFPFLWNIHLGQANWEYGEKQEFYDIEGNTYSPLICFEIAFEFLTTRMAKESVDFIVNITNDAWFKRSVGTYQHAIMTKFRAVETRKMIYRAANTGYSLIVSPTGEFLEKSKLFEKTILTSEIIKCNSNSFFTKYLFWFPVVFVVGAGLILIVCLLFRRRLTQKRYEKA
jgi:apolipoprotein N-acyltransferase